MCFHAQPEKRALTMPRRVYVAAVLAALLALLASTPHAAAAGNRVLVIHYPVSVVVYGGIPGEPPKSMVFNSSIDAGQWRIVFVFNVSFVKAPESYVKMLQGWLSRHAETGPLPTWARGCPGINDSIERVELRSYYRYVTGLTWRLLEEMGARPRFAVSVVAIPPARVLWDSMPYPWVEGFHLGFEGARIYTGWLNGSLYDLYAVQARHPSYPMPFAAQYPPVTCLDDPPLPALHDPWGRIAARTRELLEMQVANLLDQPPWYAPRLVVNITIVDYGGNVSGLLAQLETGEFRRLLQLLDPWLQPVVRLHIVPPSEAPWGPLNTSITDNGTVVIDLDANPGLTGKLPKAVGSECQGLRETCIFNFYWLIMPGPAYMTLSGVLNFTGIDLGPVAVATFPGYAGRVLHSGASRVVAHEAGHGMGLPHPFQRGHRVDWLLDYAYTVMSYEDSILAAAPPDAVMAIDAWKLALLHSIALLGNATGEERGKALGLIEEARPQAALEELLAASNPGAPGGAGVPPCGCRAMLEAILVLLLIALLLSLTLHSAGHASDRFAEGGAVSGKSR